MRLGGYGLVAGFRTGALWLAPSAVHNPVPSDWKHTSLLAAEFAEISVTPTCARYCMPTRVYAAGFSPRVFFMYLRAKHPSSVLSVDVLPDTVSALA